jgi:hypothetical protein
METIPEARASVPRVRTPAQMRVVRAYAATVPPYMAASGKANDNRAKMMA